MDDEQTKAWIDTMHDFYRHTDPDDIVTKLATSPDGEEPPPARKDDADKSRLDLLPAMALFAVGDVLAYGAAKYVANGWQQVPDAQARYRAALLRHQLAIMAGETHDQESGLLHSAHVACNALFLLWFELQAKR